MVSDDRSPPPLAPEAPEAEAAAPPPSEQTLQPILGDLLSSAVRRLIRRSRAELNRAARTGRQRLEERQLQRDLDHFWVRLGKSAYHLVQAGELDHPALRKAMVRIDDLEARIVALHEQQAEESADPPPDLASPRGEH